MNEREKLLAEMKTICERGQLTQEKMNIIIRKARKILLDQLKRENGN